MVNAFDFRKVSFGRIIVALPLAGCIYLAIVSNDVMTRAVSLAVAVVFESIRDSLLIVELTKPKKEA